MRKGCPTQAAMGPNACQRSGILAYHTICKCLNLERETFVGAHVAIHNADMTESMPQTNRVLANSSFLVGPTPTAATQITHCVMRPVRCFYRTSATIVAMHLTHTEYNYPSALTATLPPLPYWRSSTTLPCTNSVSPCLVNMRGQA
jgi:hypothetical protein